LAPYAASRFCIIPKTAPITPRARSKAEYYSKLSIAVEEADETAFWMELLIASGIVSEKKLEALYKESIEITKILAVSRKTSKNNK
jgi:four helix bundle protein